MKPNEKKRQWNTEIAKSAEAIEYTECPWYDAKQSDGEAPVMLELWGMRSTPSFISPQWSGVVAPDRVRSMGQIELVVI